MIDKWSNHIKMFFKENHIFMKQIFSVLITVLIDPKNHRTGWDHYFANFTNKETKY